MEAVVGVGLHCEIEAEMELATGIVTGMIVRERVARRDIDVVDGTEWTQIG